MSMVEEEEGLKKKLSFVIKIKVVQNVKRMSERQADKTDRKTERQMDRQTDFST